jgi:putative ABC transport system ATP-binding protein
VFSLQQIVHSYDGEVVLDLPEFVAEQGERKLVLGPSGCGKTTLLHILAGVLRPTRGRVVVAGRDLAQFDGAQLDRFRGRRIGIVFQQLHLLPTLTFSENLLLARYMAGLRQDRDRVGGVLAGVGLQGKERAYPAQTSHGQQQRAAIARAVVNEPSLILADEPTSNLDDDHAARVLDLLVSQADTCGATLIIATHDARIAERIEDRLILGGSHAGAGSR